MKEKVLLILFLLGHNANGGLFDLKYFEPAAGCAIGFAAGYISGDSDEDESDDEDGSSDKMKNGAIYCAIGGGIGLIVGAHYRNKYGKEFLARKEHYQERLDRFKLLNEQKGEKIDPNANYIIKRRIVPAQKTRNGELILPTVQESIQLKDSSDRVGQ